MGLTVVDYIGIVLAGAGILFVVVHALFIRPRYERKQADREARLKVAAILNLKGDAAAGREVMAADSLEDVVEIVKAHERRSNERGS